MARGGSQAPETLLELHLEPDTNPHLSPGQGQIQIWLDEITFINTGSDSGVRGCPHFTRRPSADAADMFPNTSGPSPMTDIFLLLLLMPRFVYCLILILESLHSSTRTRRWANIRMATGERERIVQVYERSMHLEFKINSLPVRGGGGYLIASWRQEHLRPPPEPTNVLA